jgi:4-methylaminobutanoate oxidase (formaldehyde-forming)
MATELPTRTRVVIVGGGVIGCSIAYHVGTLGWSDFDPGTARMRA